MEYDGHHNLIDVGGNQVEFEGQQHLHDSQL